MNNYPIIICDDDQFLAEELSQNIKAAIQNLTDDNEIYSKLKEKVTFIANNFAQVAGYVAANDIKNGIYLLDIELSDESDSKNGVDLAEFIKTQDNNAQIIFVTAYDKYAPLTYSRRIGAIDYISKNLSKEKTIQRLEETLRNAFDNLSNIGKNDYKEFIYKIGRRTLKVRQSEVILIENSIVQHKVHMITENGETEFKGNISQLEKQAPFLVKVSQSYLVNPDNIKAVDTRHQEIFLKNDIVINYSRAYRKVVKEKILSKIKDSE